MAENTTISLPDTVKFKQQSLLWANHFKTVCLLDSNNYPHDKYKSKDWVLAVDAVSETTGRENAFEELKKFHNEINTDIFGFFSYDLKNQIEKLSSKNHDGIEFPDLYFFKPRYLFEITGNKLTVNRNYPETFELIELISKIQIPTYEVQSRDKLQLITRTSRQKYLQNVEAIRQQIGQGDFYELNYCNEFYSENVEINPVEIFLRLNEKAKAPFSCFFKHNDKFLLCASPERFLKKQGRKLIAQPIKGTKKKGNTVEENEMLQSDLKSDEKEKAENIMIVDLMRNDLAKSSKIGSVKVEELFGIYEFNTVNQMISTVSSEILDGIHCVDIIKNAFPMGSMTGAPKVMVMENIEKYEDSKRGLFSGSVGLITTEGDFDFNVTIRSILYNSTEKYASIQAGGGITYNSVPEKEYDEMLLKTKGMIEALNAEIALN